MTQGLSYSVQIRLVRHAKSQGIDPNVVLTRYACERILYRLSRSPFADRFVLKGALLLLVWLGETIRPTRDADLLGFGSIDARWLQAAFREICALNVEPDGLEFDSGSLCVRPIRADDLHGGQRVELTAHLGKARIRVQVDIGVGDVVVPEAKVLVYPSLLNMPQPRLLAYQPETAIAEKIHAMVTLGAANSRMKDFFDVDALASRRPFTGSVLSEAIASTFAGRRTEVPFELPLALTPAFALIQGKSAQWAGFRRRLLTSSAPPEFETVLARVARFAGPVLHAVSLGAGFPRAWPPGGPWSEDEHALKVHPPTPVI